MEFLCWLKDRTDFESLYSDDEAADLIAALQDLWQMEFLPGNVRTIVKGKKKHGVVVRGAKRFGADQNP